MKKTLHDSFPVLLSCIDVNLEGGWLGAIRSLCDGFEGVDFDLSLSRGQQ